MVAGDPAKVDAVAQSLIHAQAKAAALFEAVLAEGLVRPGRLESELSTDIHELARSRFGLRRHWHKRIARAGPNTLLGYHDDPADRRIGEDDIVYLDFGPVFEEWEADFGRTFVVGTDPVKRRLVADLAAVFHQGRVLFDATPNLTAGELYDRVAGLAVERGWEFGAPTAGHLIGHFPHERAPGAAKRFSIRHGNEQLLREVDANGRERHWILEVHLVDRSRQIGGFYEQLLTA